MKLYHVDSGDLSPYYGTLGAAKKDANAAAKASYHDVHVQVVNVPTDKPNVLRLANGQGGHTQFGEIVHTAKAKLKKGN